MPPRLPLAHLPTPIHRLTRLLPALLPEVPKGHLPLLYVKRDDLTGAELSGNKVRKLEYLVADALAKGADTLITCGGEQSNHCRATALCAARMGLSSLLFLRTADPSSPPTPSGNLLLDHLAGAQIRYVTPAQYKERDRLFAEAEAELRAEGKTPYVIPEGGSNALGCYAYAQAVAEFAEQIGKEIGRRPLTIVCPVGSGGTLAGLLLGVALSDLPFRVVGINVCDDKEYFVRVVSQILKETAEAFSLSQAERLAASPECIALRDGYVGRGYGLSTQEERDLLGQVARVEGLILDPVYTCKAMMGLVSELRRDPQSLGEVVMFWHTGGIFGLFQELA